MPVRVLTKPFMSLRLSSMICLLEEAVHQVRKVSCCGYYALTMHIHHTADLLLAASAASVSDGRVSVCIWPQLHILIAAEFVLMSEL